MHHNSTRDEPHEISVSNQAKKRKRTNLLKCIAQYCTLINISENQLQFNKNE